MEENKLIAILGKHWSKIAICALCIAVLAVWSERRFRSNQRENKNDFLIAGQIFERFQKGEYLPAESIESVQNILKRHPELHPKYDLVLALTLFSQKQDTQASVYARSVVTHAHKHLPKLYQEYADATLLISEKKYQAAFAAALALEGKLKLQSDCQTLDGMNTLRLTFLARELGDKASEATYLAKLVAHPSYSSILSVFQAGNVSLSDYFSLSS